MASGHALRSRWAELGDEVLAREDAAAGRGFLDLGTLVDRHVAAHRGDDFVAERRAQLVVEARRDNAPMPS